jgi:two-component system phosphate regulon response regulator PhoB
MPEEESDLRDHRRHAVELALHDGERVADNSVDSVVLDTGEIRIDPLRFVVHVGDERADLTVTQFRILHLLASHPGWVFSRAQIIRAIRGEDYPATDRSVDVQIVGLRKKLGQSGHLIETVRGVGYRFKE